jgi:hypothetical protein
MRKVALVLAVLAILILVFVYYPSSVDKPLKNGTGLLAVQIDPSFTAPEYHSPLDQWQTRHVEVVNQGIVQQSDCLHCHQPQTTCNQCHTYVGAKEILQ